MKLEHTRYKNVTILIKGQEINFAEGIADVQNNAIAKELLKLPYIKEIKEPEIEEK